MVENNRLNINRPLLSVRRVSSTTASPKNENRRNESCAPVGSTLESPKTELNFDPMMNTGSVPFGWEHSPGKPKDERNRNRNRNQQIQTKENSPNLPKLPPGNFFTSSKKDLDTNATMITRFDSGASTSKQSSDSINDHDDDDSEAFMDALDTLSRGETSFYNCSASGVSGFASDIKPAGIIPTDPKMREFMMDRFLPAAKAMAADVSPHNSKKNIVKSKPREVIKLTNVDDKKGLLRYGPNFLEDVTHDNEDDDDDDDDDSDSDYHQHRNQSSKLCGLIPRFCSVNPVHGMCLRTKLPTSPANRTRTPASSSTISSISGSDNEPARTGIYERRSWNGVLKGKSTEATNLGGSKLYNRLQGRGVSVSFSEPIQYSVPKENSLNPKMKGLSFKELLTDNNKKETDDEDSMVEKNVYVDTVQIVRSLNKSLESDMLDNGSEHDIKSKTHSKSWKGFEDLDAFDEKFGDWDLKGYKCKGFELPAPPPLSQSPTDSWLCRTLPSKSSKNTPVQWNIVSPSSNTDASDQNADENIRSQSQDHLHPIPES
ncbi:uncharacterized protein [Rutidosis leptorrhynchoides]|uniref:uncharacterized protein n=1 Tax=Rutidosis leptorrhynchoides TaxID=125765 RepID=UPI003A99926B